MLHESDSMSIWAERERFRDEPENEEEEFEEYDREDYDYDSGDYDAADWFYEKYPLGYV